MKKYKLKLCGYYAFGSEETVLEAENEMDAIELAKKLYPDAESVVIKDIYSINS